MTSITSTLTSKQAKPSPADNETSLADNETNSILLTLTYLKNAIQEGHEENIKTYIQDLHRYSITDELLTKMYAENRSNLTLNCLIHSLLETKNENLDNARVLRDLLELNVNNHYITQKEEDDQRIQAFIYAIQISDKFNDSSIVEILYDYWCKNNHWTSYRNNKININNIERVGKSLDEACSRCKDILSRNSKLLTDSHCLKYFNKFQNELYTQLKQIQIDTNDTITTNRDVILTVLRTYNEYSNIDKMRLEKYCKKAELEIQGSLSDANNKYDRALLYVMYEMYFRKLDYNVSLIILDNSEILKTYLDNKLYKNLENSIYYFIYRANENWRLYLPTKKSIKIHHVPGCDEQGNSIEVKVIIDNDRMNNAFMLFLERENFKTSLQNIKTPIKQKQNAIKDHSSVHCLENLPHMRDDYSLQKIINDIDAIKINDCNEMDVLIIEQAIKTTGEMLKRTKDTLHLTKISKALTQFAISIETHKNLQELREYFSHTIYKIKKTSTKNTISSRIKLAKNNIDIYLKVAEELDVIRDNLAGVRCLNKLILDLDLLNRGLTLLNKRLKEFSTIGIYFRIIFNVFIRFFRPSTIDVALEEIHWIKEIIKQIICHKTDILNETKNKSYEYMVQINSHLKDMQNNNVKWEALLKDCKSIPGLARFLENQEFFPNNDSISKIKRKFKSLKEGKRSNGKNVEELKNIEEKIQLIQDYSREWNLIRDIIRFFIVKLEIYNNVDIPDNVKIKLSRSEEEERDKTSSPDKETFDFICQFIDATTSNRNQSPVMNSFAGIKELHDYFITDCKENDDNETKKDDNKNVEKDNEIDILSCLINRIDLLKVHLHDDIPLGQQVQRYNRDQKFQIILRMLLGDILNIFKKYDIRKELILKETNLLAGCNLRDVLHHGNPFLEIIGQVLDDQDFPTEVIKKANSIVKDSERIIKEMN